MAKRNISEALAMLLGILGFLAFINGFQKFQTVGTADNAALVQLVGGLLLISIAYYMAKR